MNTRINIAIAQLQLAQALFTANKHDAKIVPLLREAAAAIAQVIADAQNPIGPPSNTDERPPE